MVLEGPTRPSSPPRWPPPPRPRGGRAPAGRPGTSRSAARMRPARASSRPRGRGSPGAPPAMSAARDAAPKSRASSRATGRPPTASGANPFEVEVVEGVPGQRAPLDEAAPGALDERDPVTATAAAPTVAPIAAAPAITSTRPRDDRDVLRLAPERHPAGPAREGAVRPKPDPVAAADRGNRELAGRDVEPGPGEHEAGDEGCRREGRRPRAGRPRGALRSPRAPRRPLRPPPPAPHAVASPVSSSALQSAPPPLPVLRVKGDGLRQRTIAEHPLARPRDEAHSVFHPGFPTFSETAAGLSRRRPNAWPTVYPSRRTGGGKAAARQRRNGLRAALRSPPGRALPAPCAPPPRPD